ncbi:MAG: alpha/beta fold hydrolase, partial [Thermoanaerobaculia bacterium]
QKRHRRRRLARGLLLGGAAVGLPALANALIARRVRPLPPASWGHGRRYAWRHGEVAYRDLGKGRPLLLVHSLGPGHDSEQWRAAAEPLSDDHRVVAADLLGWGRSDKPVLRYDGELYIELLVDLLEDVIGERAALVAAGLPATYALQVAVDRPDLVSALALVTPAGLDLHADEPDLMDALVHWALRFPVLGTSALNLYTSRGALAQYLRRDLALAQDVDPGHLEHHYRSSHQRGAHAALAALLAGYSNHPASEALTRLTTPLWLAWGRVATHPPIEAADLWLHRAPRARLEIFEASANLPNLEEPAAFASRLGRWLAVEPAGARAEGK